MTMTLPWINRRIEITLEGLKPNICITCMQADEKKLKYLQEAEKDLERIKVFYHYGDYPK